MLLMEGNALPVKDLTKSSILCSLLRCYGSGYFLECIYQNLLRVFDNMPNLLKFLRKLRCWCPFMITSIYWAQVRLSEILTPKNLKFLSLSTADLPIKPCEFSTFHFWSTLVLFKVHERLLLWHQSTRWPIFLLYTDSSIPMIHPVTMV